MVICACDLPCWGVFRGRFGGPGAPVGVQRSQGASWEGLGGSQGGSGGPGGALEKVIFFFFRGEFVNGLS